MENGGKYPKGIVVSEYTGNLEILPKHMTFCYGQVVNFLIIKIKDVAIFAATFS